MRAVVGQRRIQPNAKAGRVGNAKPPVHWQRLANQQRIKHRHDPVGLGRHHQKLCERAVFACGHKVIAVNRRSVRDHHHARRIGHIGNPDQFGQPTAPAHIGLQHVAAPHLDQGAEPPARRLMLARGKPGRTVQPAFQIGIGPVIVGRQRFFDPFQPMRGGRAGQRFGIVHVQRHPAIQHQPEIRAHLVAHVGHLGDRRGQARRAINRRVDQRHLAPNEPQLLRQIGPWPGGVEDQLIAHFAAKELPDRFLPHLPQQIPQGQINAGNDVQDDPAPAIEQRPVEHLVPDRRDVIDALPFDKTGQMRLGNPGPDRAASGDAETHAAILGLNLDHQRAQDVQPKTAPGIAVLRPAGHRCRDPGVDPVPFGLIVIITTPAFDGQRTQIFDPGHGHRRVVPRGRRCQSVNS